MGPPRERDKPQNKFADGTLEQRAKELGKAKRVDDGTKERLQAGNREELKVKQKIRITRRKQKPKRFIQSEKEGEELRKVPTLLQRKSSRETNPRDHTGHGQHQLGFEVVR